MAGANQSDDTLLIEYGVSEIRRVLSALAADRSSIDFDAEHYNELELLEFLSTPDEARS